VPARAAAAGDRALPVPAGVASGVLVFLGVVEVPDPAVAVVFDTGLADSRTRPLSAAAASSLQPPLHISSEVID
jgi:hypothetical protein